MLGTVSYFLVWSVHNASIFEGLIAWAESSDNFLKRMLACYVCLTYQVSLLIVSLFAIRSDWAPVEWFLVWCITCTVSLAMYSRRVIQYE